MPAHIRAPRPTDLGFRLPAEGARHAATWAAWPFDDEEWRGMLAPAREEFAHLVDAIVGFEPVNLLVADAESAADARRRLGARADLTIIEVPLDDVWLRDSGPIFVRDGEGRVSFVHFRFNAWGGKFEWALDDEVPEAMAAHLDLDHFDVDVVLEGGSIEADGSGTALTTRQCLLTPTRNPGLEAADLERVLAETLGLTRVVWLERGLEGDHTDGHIDTIARFVAPGVVAACVAPPDDAPNHATLAENAARLRAEGFTVLEVPLPHERREFEGERLPLTYVNYCVVNGGILVPQYADPADARALAILREAFPDRVVIGLPSSAIITSGGSFHCLTQQQPEGRLWRAPAC